MPSQYDKPATLKSSKLCLNAVSKDILEGVLSLREQAKDCTSKTCKTIKLIHSLKLPVRTHAPCDSKTALPLDGTIEVKELVTEEIAETPGRGIHSGDCVWTGNNIVVKGTLNGFINIGPHRKPFISNAACEQLCTPRLVMEGRLNGKITEAKDQSLVGCEVLVAYRLRLNNIETAPQAVVSGTLEGVIVCPCAQ